MTFGGALDALKEGRKVARSGWNGKGMWLVLVNSDDYLDYGITPILRTFHPAYDYDIVPWIGMKTADDKFVPWLASQTDMLAEDWDVVE